MNGLLEVRSSAESLIAGAYEDGRVVVRAAGGRPVNFILEGDELVARVKPEDAAYFAGITGYAVEGHEPKADPAWSNPMDWFDHGTKLKEEALRGKQQEASTDPVALMLTLLGGPEAVQAMVAKHLAGQSETLAAAADQRLAEAAAARALAAENAPLSARQMLSLDEERLRDVGREFLPHLDVGAAHPAALAMELAELAERNPAADFRLRALLED